MPPRRRAMLTAPVPALEAGDEQTSTRLACGARVGARGVRVDSELRIGPGVHRPHRRDRAGWHRCRIAGVTVDVTGPQNQSTVTDTKGEAHFLNLPPGSYQVKASLSAFADFLNRAVAVTAGGAVALRVMMGVQGCAEQVRTRISRA